MTSVRDAAYQAYIYGIAPVSVYAKQYDQTNNTTEDGIQAIYAPINHMYVSSTVDTPQDQLFVTPNVNVVYASAHLDFTQLTDGATSVLANIQPNPRLHASYWVWQVMDAFTNDYFYIGSRATGGEGGYYQFAPPGFDGDVYDGFTLVECTSNCMWIVARYFFDTPDTTTNFQASRDALIHSPVYPNTSFFTNAVNPDWNPGDYVDPLDIGIEDLAFFYRLNEWLKTNGWGDISEDDQAMFEDIGIGPDSDTDFNNLSDRDDYLEGASAARTYLIEQQLSNQYLQNYHNWDYYLGPEMGQFGTEYEFRALVALGGLGANIVEECTYPECHQDDRGEMLDSNNKYTITLESKYLDTDSLVNTNGFWSITPYTDTDHSLAEHAEGPDSVGLPVTDFYIAEDETVTIYLQQTAPEDDDEKKNWLPTPSASNTEFFLIWRFYYPNSEVYDEPPSFQCPEVAYVDS